MRGTHSLFRAVALAGDLAIAALALYLAFLLRTRVSIPGTQTLLPLENVRFTPINILLVTAAQGISLSLFGLYGARQRFRDPLPRLLLPALFFQLIGLAAIYFLANPYSFPRSVLLLYLFINGVLLMIWRSVLDRLFPQARRRAVIVGDGPAVSLIAETIRKHPWTGVDVIGTLGSERSGVDLPRLGPIESLAAIVSARGSRK